MFFNERADSLDVVRAFLFAFQNVVFYDVDKSIIGDAVIDGVNTVTVEFYADSTRFIKTDIVEYYLDDEERILGCKRIDIGDYEPFELYNLFGM